MSSPDYKFAFGNFNYICSTVSLTLCPLVGEADGIEPVCYSRNVRLADTLIFQPCKPLFLVFEEVSMDFQTYDKLPNIAFRPCSAGKLHVTVTNIATLIIHLIALIMTAIMIYHIRSKYTAVGMFIAPRVKRLLGQLVSNILTN